jgi:hypothetical protein
MTMPTMDFDQIAALALDPDNGWSIGSFGAIGEFIRDPDEHVTIHLGEALMEIATARGAMRIAPRAELAAIAWDSLSRDGESWGHALALCCPRPETPNRAIRELGPDTEAIRHGDRGDLLFDMGVAAGAVRMCLRTRDEGLIAACRDHQGSALSSAPGLMAQVLRAQPHRVLTSPAGRIEVFQPIPPAGGKSPEGPHTHLLAKLVPKDRAHGSNTPIPDGLQSALNIHPRSPWRNRRGERYDFTPAVDAAFAPLLHRFGLPEDREIDRWLRDLIDSGLSPEFADWPGTRRGRTKARIVLRRLAATGDPRVVPWRALHDRAPIEIEEGEEP